MKRLLLGVAAAIFLLLSSCVATNTPDSILTDLQNDVSIDFDKAMYAWLGKEVKLNLKVEGISNEGILSIQCSDFLLVKVVLPKDEANRLKSGDVITIQGKISSMQPGILSKVIINPAHVVTDEFVVSGEIEGIYHDWDQNAQAYCVIWENGILADRQLVIYLPEDNDFSTGDSIKAEGKVICTEGIGLALSRNSSSTEMLIMKNPELLYKAND